MVAKWPITKQFIYNKTSSNTTDIIQLVINIGSNSDTSTYTVSDSNIVTVRGIIGVVENNRYFKITGNNFSNVKQILFGPTYFSEFKILSDTLIEVKAPLSNMQVGSLEGLSVIGDNGQSNFFNVTAQDRKGYYGELSKDDFCHLESSSILITLTDYFQSYQVYEIDNANGLVKPVSDLYIGNSDSLIIDDFRFYKSGKYAVVNMYNHRLPIYTKNKQAANIIVSNPTQKVGLNHYNLEIGKPFIVNNLTTNTIDNKWQFYRSASNMNADGKELNSVFYNTIGTKPIRLISTGTNGCIDTNYVTGVKVYEPVKSEDCRVDENTIVKKLKDGSFLHISNPSHFPNSADTTLEYETNLFQKKSSNGLLQWGLSFPHSSNSFVETDESDNIYIVFRVSKTNRSFKTIYFNNSDDSVYLNTPLNPEKFSNTTDQPKLFVLKFNKDGRLLWSTYFKSEIIDEEYHYYPSANSIKILKDKLYLSVRSYKNLMYNDGNGDKTLAMNFEKLTDMGSIYTYFVQLDTTGKYKWSYVQPNQNPLNEYGIVTDNDDNVYCKIYAHYISNYEKSSYLMYLKDGLDKTILKYTSDYYNGLLKINPEGKIIDSIFLNFDINNLSINSKGDLYIETGTRIVGSSFINKSAYFKSLKNKFYELGLENSIIKINKGGDYLSMIRMFDVDYYRSTLIDDKLYTFNYLKDPKSFNIITEKAILSLGKDVPMRKSIVMFDTMDIMRKILYDNQNENNNYFSIGRDNGIGFNKLKAFDNNSIMLNSFIFLPQNFSDIKGLSELNDKIQTGTLGKHSNSSYFFKANDLCLLVNNSFESGLPDSIEVCKNAYTYLKVPAKPGYRYKWYPSSFTNFMGISDVSDKNEVRIKSERTGYISLSVIDNHGNIYYDSVKVIVSDKVGIPYLPIPDRSICLGDSVTFNLTVDPSNNIRWTSSNQFVDSVKTVKIKPTDTTTYFLHIYNNDGCDVFDTIQVNVTRKDIIPEITISIDSSKIDSCNVNTIYFIPHLKNAGEKYRIQWFRNGNLIALYDSLQIHNYLEGDEIYAIVTQENDCSKNSDTSNIVTIRNHIRNNLSLVLKTNKNDICDSEPVDITAEIQGGLKDVQYKFFINGRLHSRESPYFSIYLKPNDKVYAEVQYTGKCGYTLTERSDTVIMRPNANAKNAIINLTADRTKVCNNEEVSFNITYSDGGTTPKFTWYKNDNVIATGPTSYNISVKPDDKIFVELLSSESCAVKRAVASNVIAFTSTTNEYENLDLKIENISTNLCESNRMILQSNYKHPSATLHYWFRTPNVYVPSTENTISDFFKSTDSVKLVLPLINKCGQHYTFTSNTLYFNTLNKVESLTGEIIANKIQECEREILQLEAKVSGGSNNLNGRVQYVWLKNNVQIPNERDSILKLVSVNVNDIYRFQATVDTNNLCLSNNIAGNSLTANRSEYIPRGKYYLKLNLENPNHCMSEPITISSNTLLHNFTDFRLVWYHNNGKVAENVGKITLNSYNNNDVIFATIENVKYCTSPIPISSDTIVVSSKAPVTGTVSISASPQNYCYNTPVVITANSNAFISNTIYKWRINNRDSITNSNKITLLIHEKTKVSLNAIFQNPCSTTDSAVSNSLDLEVVKFPVSFSLDGNQLYVVGDSYYFSVATPQLNQIASKFYWEDSIANRPGWQVISNNLTLNYTVTNESKKLRYRAEYDRYCYPGLEVQYSNEIIFNTIKSNIVSSPNPFINYIRINGLHPDDKWVSVVLSDYRGNVLITRNNINGLTTVEMNTFNVIPGHYYLIFTNESGKRFSTSIIKY